MMGDQDMKYKISKEFFPLYYFSAPPLPPRFAGFLGSVMKPQPWIFLDNAVRVRTVKISTFDSKSIKLYIMSPRKKEQPTPCIVYFHGGGFTYGAAWHHYSMCKRYAIATGSTVIIADYRLSPRYPFPTPAEDCYSAYEWTQNSSAVLGIDKMRIAVAGDSAGGALCAAVSQMARDRGISIPLFQMLIYPVTDRRMITESMRSFTDTPMWNAKMNAKMWTSYLKDTIPDNIGYASPLEAENTASLPDTYIETAEFDCLRDEGRLYAEKLSESGVRVTLDQTKGTFHAYDVMSGAKTTKTSVQKRIEYIKAKFSE